MSDRFEFEQSLLDCWKLVDDLKYLVETDLNYDEIKTILEGLQKLYNLKFDKTFKQFENLIHERKIL